MGRLGYEPVIQHFSHLHPMQLLNLKLQTPATCAGCKLLAAGWAYACAACNHHLHISCAQMPQFISHPADPHHPLALLPVPTYAEGSFTCDACGVPGDGFSYRCAECGLDIHTLCASMPLSVAHHAHPHPLALAFSPPYAAKGFSCDVCGAVGTSQWLYRCAACEFDTHLGCATARAPHTQRAQPGAAGVGLPTRAWPGKSPGGVAAPPVVGCTGSSGRPGSGGLVGQAIEAFLDGAAQQVGQNLAQSLLGGGGGSSNPVLDIGSSVVGAVVGADGSSN